MSAEPAIATIIDVAGAARDLDERARRWAPVYAVPDLADVVRLLQRNPSVASELRPVVEAAIAKLPGGGVPLSAPMWSGTERA